jgi:pimeloyl-ACP methyl ester carboxylesterase
MKALDAGDVQRAVELNVDGVQDSKGAYAKMPEAVRRMMLDNARTIAELGTDFPRFTAEEARKISSRTLVINGEASALWLRRIGELVARAVPNARRTLVPNARHFPHMENPQVFNDRLLAFLGESA